MMFIIGAIVVILCLFVAYLSIMVAGTRQRVDKLEDDIRRLRGELSTIGDNVYNKTMIEYLQVGDGTHIGIFNNVTVKAVVQMLMKHSGLKIKKTQEKISLEIVNAEPLKDNQGN